ncbi:18327_t:CDS:10 [Funneliformis geosporum]|nr:18327_t:CDS:10 [Funneliformis geosporum]
MEKTPHIPKRTSSFHSGSLPVVSSSDDLIFSSNVEDYDINTNSPIGGSYGASAIVYGALYKPLNKRVAVKMIDLDFFERNQIDEVRRETQLMSLSKHANVLRVCGSFVNESKLYIVTPYMSADEDGSVLLADFGVSSSLTENGDRRGFRRTFVGTPCWMAPEVMEHAGYDYKADIWSFGITALELSTGHAPFAKFPPLKVIMVTLSNEPPTLDRESTKHKYSRTFKEMIDMCLQKDPTKRPSTERLLNHPFFRPAKKKDFLVSKILQHLPPLEERPHKIQQKPITYNKGVTWDFAVDSEYRENDDQETAASQEANDGTSEGKRVEFSVTGENNDASKTDSSAAAVVPPKKSRFLVGDAVAESHQPLSLSVPTTPSATFVSSQNPLSKSQPLSAGTNFVPNPFSSGEKDELNAQIQTQQSQGIKKGRFNVVSNGSRERALSSGTQPESDNQQLPQSKESIENLTESNKKSRFELQQPPQPLDNPTLTSSSSSQNLSRESSVISLSRDSTLSKGDTLLTKEGTINGGSLDVQTTEKAPEKPVGTKKGRFQVSSVDVPPKIDGSISPSGNLLTSETTYSPQSTFLGHSPSISPATSILRGQGQHMMSTSSHIKTLLQQNETQRAILNELLYGTSAATIVGRMAQPQQYNAQHFQSVNGNTGGINRNSSKEISSYLSYLDRQIQCVLRDNEELRKENESLRRENEKLKKSSPLNSLASGKLTASFIPTTTAADPSSTKSASGNISNA